METNLATYLNDHLAGARFAIDLLTRLRDTSSDANFCAFANELLGDIETDRAVVQELVDRISSKSVLKEATAWVAEKASRVKLRLGSEDNLAVFEALEALALGVLGKQKLWYALHRLSKTDDRVAGPDYRELAELAQAQHDRLEERRLMAADTAFRADG
jgi:hypothetical protein